MKREVFDLEWNYLGMATEAELDAADWDFVEVEERNGKVSYKLNHLCEPEDFCV